jgi:hypothetical protein
MREPFHWWVLVWCFRGSESLAYVVVKEGVGHGDPVGAVRDVKETVEVVLAGGQVAREVDVVNPDIGDLVERDGIAVLGEDLLDLQVADDNVGHTADLQADTSDGFGKDVSFDSLRVHSGE